MHFFAFNLENFTPDRIFYTGQIFESQFLHPKILKNTHLLQQMVPKSAKYAVFCIQSGNFYTGRIFESQYFSPQKCKICIFLRLISKILHQTEFFTQAPPVVPVTNMRYARQRSNIGCIRSLRRTTPYHTFHESYHQELSNEST